MFVLPEHHRTSATAQDLSRQVLGQHDLIEILNHLPYMALILTGQREVVFANRALLETLGLAGIDENLGIRPGELLLCVNSRVHAEGCGGAEGCRHCQALQVLNDCLHKRQKVVREARVSARVGGRLVAYDLKITATPLELASHELAMVFLEDIGAQKRREHLESIFLHDLLNSVVGLQLSAEQLQHDPARFRPAELSRQVQLLTDEIRAQQILIEAERGDLQRDILCVPARGLLEDTLTGIQDWCNRRGIAITLALPATPIYLATDPLVARRVLLNAVKNAVEASIAGEAVKIGVVDQPPHVVITVWNAGVMAEHTQHQVFQRSFSTKGDGRGLGTYSMRLLMENYLGGTAGFTSDPAAGTIFTLTFPSMQSYLANVG
ncbi:MAG: sensor histidine kinase [Desulfuromonadales bacterium]|nr:sensor histidine kinase [Desulfuromonadales bacterium]